MPSPDFNEQNVHSHTTLIPDETTPLIAVENAGITSQTNAEPFIAGTKSLATAGTIGRHNGDDAEDEDDEVPLPRGQIFMLCVARTVEPIAFFSIFPFISKMIEDTGSIPMEDVGFYAGLIESFFSLTQMIVMVVWGWASDRFGRKPILVISMIGVGVGTTAFGFATNVWQMILFRCFAGVFAGSLVTIRTLFSENSTPRTQARAFSFFALAGNVGIFIGPLIGGGLSIPAEQYPRVFGKVELFKRYPYALPTIVAGLSSIIIGLLSLIFVKETLKKTGDKIREKPMSTLQLVKSPGVATVLFLYSWGSLVALSYTAIVPVFWFTSPELGGFGFSPFQISCFLALAGICQATWSILVFPPWHNRVGTGRIMRFLYTLYPFAMCLPPVNAVLRRNGYEAAFWTLVGPASIFGSAMSMNFTAIQLALNDVVPTQNTLGMMNALALTLASGIRAVAPAAFASLFAVGVSKHILWGYFAWALLIPMSMVLRIVVVYLPEKVARAPSSRKRPTQDVPDEAE